MAELPAQLVLAKVLRRTDGISAQADIENALARAEALIEQTGAALYAPRLHEERAAFARLLGRTDDAARELREAKRLYGAMDAPIRVDSITRELERMGAGPADD